MSNDIVFLNVGGTVFQTTRSTLTSTDCFFARLWSEGSNWADASESTGTHDNPLFIDRDPQAFPGILAYLRSGKAVLGAHDAVYLQLLALEADFFLLPGLTSAIEDEQAKRVHIAQRGLFEWNVVETSCSVRGDFRRGWQFVESVQTQEPRTLMVIKRQYSPEE